MCILIKIQFGRFVFGTVDSLFEYNAKCCTKSYNDHELVCVCVCCAYIMFVGWMLVFVKELSNRYKNDVIYALDCKTVSYGQNMILKYFACNIFVRFDRTGCCLYLYREIIIQSKHTFRFHINFKKCFR